MIQIATNILRILIVLIPFGAIIAGLIAIITVSMQLFINLITLPDFVLDVLALINVWTPFNLFTIFNTLVILLTVYTTYKIAILIWSFYVTFFKVS